MKSKSETKQPEVNKLVEIEGPLGPVTVLRNIPFPEFPDEITEENLHTLSRADLLKYGYVMETNDVVEKQADGSLKFFELWHHPGTPVPKRNLCYTKREVVPQVVR